MDFMRPFFKKFFNIYLFFLIAGIIDACLCFILANSLTGRQVLFVKVIKLCTAVLCIFSCTKPNKPLYLISRFVSYIKV